MKGQILFSREKKKNKKNISICRLQIFFFFFFFLPSALSVDNCAGEIKPM